MPGGSPALLGMLDIEVLNILKITVDEMGDPHESRKFDSQTIEASNGPSCKTKPNRSRQIIGM